MIFDLNKFDSYREDNRLEVKTAGGGLPKSIWETYSAFANSYGGCIVCGVSEKSDGSWKTTGLNNLQDIKKNFWDTIHNKKKVSVCLINESDVEEYMVDDDAVLVINVPKANPNQKPVYINNDVFGGSFRRDYEGDYHCTESEVKAMIRDSSSESADGRLVDCEIDFDEDSVKSFRSRFNNKHDGSAWIGLSDEEFLIQIGALDDSTDKVCQTAAGLLMFGKEKSISKEFPDYFLDYQEHMDSEMRWTDRIYSQEPEWSGNVFDFYTRVSTKLLLDLKKPFRLEGQVRSDETHLHSALREALVNCLVNADFNQPWNVVIDKYPNMIVIANPGTILVGKNQMLKGGISQPRNKTLFKMFNLIGLGEHAGSGVPDIYHAWKEANYADPIVEERFGNGEPDRTILTLPLTSEFGIGDAGESVIAHSRGEAEMSIEEIKQILEFCSVPRKRIEIQEFSGYSSAAYLRKKVLHPLLDGGQLMLTIPEKPNHPNQKYVRKGWTKG